MWLLLAGMVVSALVAAFAFTSLLYTVSPQLGSLVIMSGALLGLVAWLTIALVALGRAYEPGRPTSLPATPVPGALKSSAVKS